MRWRWCDMCQYDRHCENQDRNKECACYAREQTLRAEQYGNLIDKQQEKIKKLKKQLEIAKDFIFRCANDISGDWYINNAKGTLKKIEELEK